MIDGIDGRLWAEHGHQFSENIATLFRQTRIAFKRLNAIEFDAPWKHEPTRRGASRPAC